MNRDNWPPIDWAGRIVHLGQVFISKVTGIPVKTLVQYRYHLCTPSHRNGRLIVELCDGVLVPRQVQVDWFRMLDELKRSGMSTYRVSQDPAIPQSTLIGYKGGAEPKYGDGEILIEYYRAVTGKTLEQVPLRRVESSAGRVK